MKLHASVWYTCASSYDIVSAFVDEQQNRRDKRRQAPGQLRRAFQRDGTRALSIEHKADSVGSGLDGGIDVLLACQAADLDAGTGGNEGHGRLVAAAAQGSQANGGVSPGSPQRAS